MWDNGNSVKVTHGNTRCTDIDFVDVLNAIKVYAFESSKYPLIISIENHCKKENQKLMADYFSSIFKGVIICFL